MINRKALDWCPFLYVASRVKRRSEWNQRNLLFAGREDWDWNRWQSAINTEAPWDYGLFKFIIINVGSYFGVNWKKLRPSDSLAAELLIPGEKMHWIMASELFNEIEGALSLCTDVEDYKNLLAPIELYSGTINEFLRFFQNIWGTHHHSDTPLWEKKTY